MFINKPDLIIPMEITFLGTSCMVPTKERNVPAIFLSYKAEGILFDCGEGTQRQMNITGIKRTKATKILISHWHGDHVSGIIGLIQTLGNNETPPKLEIYGPPGTKVHMNHLMNTCIFDTRVDIKIIELKPKKVERFFETEDFALECAELKHTIPCIGYSFIEKDKIKIKKSYLTKNGIPSGPHLQKLQEGKDIKYKGKLIKAKDATYLVEGKKITYTGDTMPCKQVIALAKNADILICESTFLSKLKDKALKSKHMTAKEAGLIANQSNAKKLILTHFSQRYKSTLELEEEARIVFDNTLSAYDFMKIRL